MLKTELCERLRIDHPILSAGFGSGAGPEVVTAVSNAGAAAGVDFVIAQGVEAGGHVRGTTALSVLLPAVVDAVTAIPVLASGGVADGRGLVAALSLGAQGVSMGTRFVASEEAFVPRL